MKVSKLKIYFISGFLIALVAPTELVFAAGNNGQGQTYDSWDDDVWADWGTPPQNNSGKSEVPQFQENPPDSFAESELKNYANPSTSRLSGGQQDGKIRFNLVQEGINDEPKGVRKYRPDYKKRTLR